MPLLFCPWLDTKNAVLYITTEKKVELEQADHFLRAISLPKLSAK